MNCLLLLLLALMPRPAFASGSGQADFSKLDEVALEELKATRTPGGAIAIVIGDRVVYAKGYGVANVETGAPVTPEMLFRMGSTTKMFTAAALATLGDSGKLRLDAPIGDYVKGLSPKLSLVTGHQLLSNTSGMRDFAAPFISHDDEGLARNVLSWKDDVFFAEPGDVYSYSSPGFWLAGFVIEQVGGKPYADGMEELIFKPLGMNRTTLRPLSAMTYPMSLGHNSEGGKPPAIIRPFFNNTAMWPAGSIFSNVLDLSRFAIALMNGGKLEGRQALPASVAAKLPARHALMPGDPDVSYGYGLLSFNDRGVRVVMHGGFSRGYGSTIQMVPEHRFAVIVLTNRSGETLGRSREKAMELALPLKPRAERNIKPLPITEDEMKDFAGSYSHAPQVWEVFIKDGKLFLRIEGAEAPLTRVGESRFAAGTEGEEVAFVRGADGRAEYIFNGLYSARRVRK
ncbi:MAG TPA: serine hydrolase [Blastocatellia bacterium]|nr:serine hydrolase [Blastocatellia bacterium]